MYGQKRAHSPDGSEDNSFRQGPFQPQYGRGGHSFHPHQRFSGHQPYHKRHRGDHYQQDLSIEDKIARLGETGSHNSDIGMLAKDINADLSNRSQDEERIKVLAAKICKSIVSFPTRVGTYATLIGLISVKHYNVACQIIQTLHASYPVYLEAQKWQEALTIIHLLSSLVNCNVIRPSALLSQFEFLLESTLEDNIPQARSDYYVYTVLSSLPFVALELSQKEESKENFEKMLTTIETYLSKRSKEHLSVIRVWMSSDSTIQMDYLDSLWIQTKNFRANNWMETYLLRPYNEKEYKENMESSLIPTNSPTFQIPGHSDKYAYPSPRIVFRVFEDDVVENQKSIPGPDKIERFCIENNIRNTIDENSANLRECARHLTHMFRWEQLPLKHLLIETILGELFTLPQPKHEEILYHTLLYEFTKIFFISPKPDEIKNNYDIVLNEAVKVLFDNLEAMSVTCFTRFVKWFSFHLNVTNFIYPWPVWKAATNKEANSPKASFVRGILEHCIRFGYHKKVEALVHEDLKPLMPPEVSISFQPVLVDNPNAKDLADTIRKLIAYKADGVEICTKLNIKVDSVQLPDDFVVREEKLADQLLKVDIFTAVLLDMAQKSLTHLSSAFGKYRNVLKALVCVPQGQVQLLQTMHSCLVLHPQLQVILVDKLLKADLLESGEICNWVFSEAMKPYHTQAYPWEILNNTIKRVLQNIDNMVAEKNKPKEDENQQEEEEEADKKRKNDGSGTPNPEDDDDNDDETAANGDKANNGDVVMKVESETDKQKEQAHTDELERLDARISQERKSFKELITKVFAMFASVLGDHIRKCESEQKSFIDYIYYWLTGRMQEVYYNHYDQVKEITGEIRGIIDTTPSIGSTIVNLNQ